MNRKLFIFPAAVFLITGMLIPLAGGCSTPGGEGFAIYLTRDNVTPDRMIVMSHIELAEEPVFSAKDIISYDAQTHEIALKESGIEKIEQINVPVSGTSFMVCIDRAPVYSGAFWTDLSSLSFNGVIIKLNPGSGFGSGSIRLSPGYPSDTFFTGEDPRNDIGIMESLDDWGKLVNELPTTSIEKLPHSMKGYEIYSWQENNEWYFRLITGTNRNKSYEEIVNESSFLDGFVSVRTEGIDGIRSILGKLPVDEEVFWLDGHSLDVNESPEVRMPDKTLIEKIRQYADACGIKLNVVAAQ